MTAVGAATTRLPWRTLLATALAVLVVAGLVVVGLQARSVLDLRHRDDLRRQALAAATQVGVDFTTLDYRSFDRDARSSGRAPRASRRPGSRPPRC